MKRNLSFETVSGEMLEHCEAIYSLLRSVYETKDNFAILLKNAEEDISARFVPVDQKDMEEVWEETASDVAYKTEV